ncbi:unnamed protein product [Arabis nemorensis]|uniref:Uncharacterized protein n=1 Tax=Arabis nemorensis TaxID=586526 RepID=A0A565B7P9_9BRAS|nr:unnamed protein product [Arabis nemorensis]
MSRIILRSVIAQLTRGAMTRRHFSSPVGNLGKEAKDGGVIKLNISLRLLCSNPGGILRRYGESFVIPLT